MALEAPGQRVPRPLPSTPGLWWGGPQSHSGKGFRARSSLGPHKAGSPHPTPGHLQKHSLTQGGLLSPPLPAFHLPSPFLWPICVTKALGFLSRLQVSKRPSMGVTVAPPLWAAAGPVPLIPLWQGPNLGRGAWGWAQSPAVQLLLSQFQFNKSVHSPFVGVNVLTAKGASFMVWACV